MRTCSEIVGSTLGPGGMAVVIEAQDERLPPMITKDGVTVFRNLGFEDSGAHVIMEAARDASVRTASEAGDGTTTATILAEALVRKTMEFCEQNPKVSPRRVVATLERGFREIVKPFVTANTFKANLGTEEGRKRLLAVARISANGDGPLADAVLDCFDLVGDNGNVTLLEATGTGGYEVERIEGYPIGIGYEDSCGKFYQGFINNPSRQTCDLKNPTYILYHGRLNDLYTALPLFDKIDSAAQAGQISPNVVLIATGFSEVVLAHLHTNFLHSGTLNVFPLQAPLSASKTGQYDFLADMRAVTGGQIFDPLNAPLDGAEIEQLGSTEAFEASRFRSTVIGFKDEILVVERVQELESLVNSGTLSQLDVLLVQERIGKISGGIAKLKVLGSSSGEIREKRDRAEDAICAVRGAIRHGALPAGGWTLLKLQDQLLGPQTKFSETEAEILREVLVPALFEPVQRLFSNAGYHDEEVQKIVADIRASEQPLTFDVLEGSLVDPLKVGILDSAPAVLEAIKNSISIASLLGTCGGTVVFKRDLGVERQEARDTQEFMRNANLNEADERP